LKNHRLRVNFGKIEGLLCKMAGEFQPGIIFQRINSWTGSTSPWTGRACLVHRGPTVARTEGGPGHGGALTGARPPTALVRQSSPAGAQKGERSTGSSARASPELGRRCGGWAMLVQNREAAALGEDTAQAWTEGKRSGERCGATRGWCSPFIGVGGAPGRKCRWVTAEDLRSTPLMADDQLRRGAGEACFGSIDARKGVDLTAGAQLTER
jgi:hypothetical protein